MCYQHPVQQSHKRKEWRHMKRKEWTRVRRKKRVEWLVDQPMKGRNLKREKPVVVKVVEPVQVHMWANLLWYES